MVKVKCNFCKKIYDDATAYVENLDSILLRHIKKHEDSKKLAEWFTNVPNTDEDRHD